jgi:hypothetical protein
MPLSSPSPSHFSHFLSSTLYPLSSYLLLSCFPLPYLLIFVNSHSTFSIFITISFCLFYYLLLILFIFPFCSTLSYTIPFLNLLSSFYPLIIPFFSYILLFILILLIFSFLYLISSVLYLFLLFSFLRLKQQELHLLLPFLKVHKHEIFFKTFFAETETLWSQGPVTRDF